MLRALHCSVPKCTLNPMASINVFAISPPLCTSLHSSQFTALPCTALALETVWKVFCLLHNSCTSTGALHPSASFLSAACDYNLHCAVIHLTVVDSLNDTLHYALFTVSSALYDLQQIYKIPERMRKINICLESK